MRGLGRESAAWTPIVQKIVTGNLGWYHRRCVRRDPDADAAGALLADALSPAAASRAGLLRRLPVAGAAGSAAHRPPWPPAGRAFPDADRGLFRIALRRLPAVPQPLLDRRLRPAPRRGGLDRRRAVAPGAPRIRQRAPDGAPLGDLHVVRPHRPGLVRLRLGDPAP